MELPIKIQLEYPVKEGESEVNELVIQREMVAGDLRGIKVENMLFDDMFLVASRLTGVPLNVIMQMRMVDTRKLTDAIGVFFDNGR
ncbi:MAG: phage tail assembly protein [Deltaproteobacteria bacterium]|nr:phage tail assembly protein [Deltaproteobacteria bacterium]